MPGLISSPIPVAAGVLFHNHRLLITQRHPHDPLGGLWEFPGGKCEPGESFPQALQRELKEELDIEVRVGALLHEIVHAYPDRRVHLRFFRCHITTGSPKPIACAALAWVTAAQLPDYRFPEADAPLIERLRTLPFLWLDPVG